jgi:hypothetical protein
MAPDRTYDIFKFTALITTTTAGTPQVRCRLTITDNNANSDVNICYSTFTVTAGVFYSTNTFISTTISPTQNLQFCTVQGIGWESSSGYLNVDIWYKEK